MKKLIIVLFSLIVGQYITGCGTTTVNTPKIPNIPNIAVNTSENEKIDFQPPVPLNIRFIEKSGKNLQIKDNVSVRVASITDTIDDNQYTVKIDAPDGKEYTYSLFPMMLVLEIKNDTDHIIRLTRTIIHIEDENQVEYPLISSFNASKKWLIGEIERSFDDYYNKSKLNIDTIKIEQEYKDEYREVVFSTYKEDYERFEKELLKAHKDPMKEGARLPETRKGYHLNDHGIKVTLDKYDPQKVYSDGASQISTRVNSEAVQKVNVRNSRLKNDTERLKEESVQKINDLPNVSGMITKGEYLPISILPGRTKKIIAPISKRFPEEKIREVNVSVFDLPTKVNAAGDPIKRTTFIFHFYTERI